LSNDDIEFAGKGFEAATGSRRAEKDRQTEIIGKEVLE
jgi:hypothetical protein